MSENRDFMTRELPPWLNAVLIFGTLATVVYFEIQRPLRKMTQDKFSRDVRNHGDVPYDGGNHIDS